MLSLHLFLIATSLVQGLPIQVSLPGEVPPLQQVNPVIPVQVASLSFAPAQVNSLGSGSAPITPSGYTTSYAGNHNHGNEDDDRPSASRSPTGPIDRDPAAAHSSGSSMTASLLQYLMRAFMGGPSTSTQRPQDVVSSTKSFLNFMQATGIENDLWSMMKKTMTAYMRGGLTSLTGSSAATTFKPAMLPLAGNESPAQPSYKVTVPDEDEKTETSPQSQYNNRPPLAMT